MNSKKYGVDLIHFTHTPNTAIHSSTKVDGTTFLFLFLKPFLFVFFYHFQIFDVNLFSDTIRYLSLPDNKYLRYFSGHTKK